jgi:methylase of polypeptide subunit release factors
MLPTYWHVTAKAVAGQRKIAVDPKSNAPITEGTPFMHLVRTKLYHQKKSRH